MFVGPAVRTWASFFLRDAQQVQNSNFPPALLGLQRGGALGILRCSRTPRKQNSAPAGTAAELAGQPSACLSGWVPVKCGPLWVTQDARMCSGSINNPAPQPGTEETGSPALLHEVHATTEKKVLPRPIFPWPSVIVPSPHDQQSRRIPARQCFSGMGTKPVSHLQSLNISRMGAVVLPPYLSEQ